MFVGPVGRGARVSVPRPPPRTGASPSSAPRGSQWGGKVVRLQPYPTAQNRPAAKLQAWAAPDRRRRLRLPQVSQCTQTGATDASQCIRVPPGDCTPRRRPPAGGPGCTTGGSQANLRHPGVAALLQRGRRTRAAPVIIQEAECLQDLVLWVPAQDFVGHLRLSLDSPGWQRCIPLPEIGCCISRSIFCSLRLPSVTLQHALNAPQYVYCLQSLFLLALLLAAPPLCASRILTLWGSRPSAALRQAGRPVRAAAPLRARARTILRNSLPPRECCCHVSYTLY